MYFRWHMVGTCIDSPTLFLYRKRDPEAHIDSGAPPNPNSFYDAGLSVSPHQTGPLDSDKHREIINLSEVSRLLSHTRSRLVDIWHRGNLHSRARTILYLCAKRNETCSDETTLTTPKKRHAPMVFYAISTQTTHLALRISLEPGT